MNEVEERKLSDLKPGEKGIILRVDMEGTQRRRLMDLGFLPGTSVENKMVSPSGDPTAYRVRDTLIALRQDQAGTIIVQVEVDKEKEL